MHEPGSREIALIEHGAVVLEIDGEHHSLAAGDCVTFDADLPHHFENPGPGDAALIAVVSAGLRRS
jgi:mannose-6-phosphate isomerase-like protein (cupin superfamily)